MARKSNKLSEPDLERLRLKNNHTWENGRRYHGYKSEFPFPDDYETKAGIIWRNLTARKPFVARLICHYGKNTKILDVAARSGAWLYSLLDSDDGTYAKAQVTELEPAWMVGDSEPAWLLHQDLEVFGARGWVEIWEHDLKFCPREGKEKEMEGKWDATKQWSGLMDKAAQKFGKRINMGVKRKELMEKARLVDIQEHVFKVPTREWTDNPTTKIGSEYHRHLIYHIEGYSLRLFTKILGWSKEDTDNLLNHVLQELDQEDLQLYSLFYLVIGRKPTSAAR